MMPKEVIMPALGMAQEYGLLLNWLKNEGDLVKQGDPIMEIETDKITVEIEAPANGTLVSMLAHAGDKVPVGEVVAYILHDHETFEDLPVVKNVKAIKTPSEPREIQIDGGDISPVAARMIAEHDINVAEIQANGGRITKKHIEDFLEKTLIDLESYRLIPASPKARRLASEKGYDLNMISGSGPEGAVLTKDVLNFSPSIQAEVQLENVESETRTIETSRLWQVMAKRMSESWRNIPHFYLKRDVIVNQLIDWRARLKQKSDISVTYTDILVKICAEALKKHERLNAWYQDESIIANDTINIGLAIAVDEGLLVPVIHSADKLSVTEIAKHRNELVHRAHHNKLQPSDMTAGTFTISNLGMLGINEFSAIVNPPQVAILAVGNIQQELQVIEDEIVQNQIMTLTLSCDHRAVDGARGAQFLQTLAEYMEDPLMMLS